MRRLFALLLAIAFLLPLCAAAEDSEMDPISALDEAVDGKFKRFQSRCGEVVIAKDGEIVYQAA